MHNNIIFWKHVFILQNFYQIYIYSGLSDKRLRELGIGFNTARTGLTRLRGLAISERSRIRFYLSAPASDASLGGEDNLNSFFPGESRFDGSGEASGSFVFINTLERSSRSEGLPNGANSALS